MRPTNIHPNHKQPTLWSLGLGMSADSCEIRYDLHPKAEKPMLGFANGSLIKEAGR